MLNDTLIETGIKPKRRFLRRSWFLVTAVTTAGLAVLAIIYGVQHFSARARLDSAIAEARANGEPVWFSDLDPGPGKNPSKDAKELMRLSEDVVFSESDRMSLNRILDSCLPPEFGNPVAPTQDDYRRLHQVAASNREALREIQELAEHGEFWFARNYEDISPLDVEVAHVQELRRVQYAAMTEVLDAIQANNVMGFEQSIQGYFALIGILKNDFLIASQVVQLGWLESGISLLELWLQQNQLSDETADGFEKRLLDIESNLRLAPVLFASRAIDFTVMANLDDSDNQEVIAAFVPEMLVHELSSPWDELVSSDLEQRIVARWISPTYRTRLIEQLIYMLDQVRQLALQIDEPGPLITGNLKDLERKHKSLSAESPLCRILLPGMTLSRDALMRVRQLAISASILLHLYREHGERSDSPEQLTAALEARIAAAPAGYFSGKPLQYRIEGSTISLYDVNPVDGMTVGEFTLMLSSHDAAEADTGIETSSEEGAP